MHFVAFHSPHHTPTPLPSHLRLPHVDHTPNTITLLHRIESLVDILQCLAMSDKLIDLQLTSHVVVNQIRKLRASFDATKSAAFPDTASDKLEC